MRYLFKTRILASFLFVGLFLNFSTTSFASGELTQKGQVVGDIFAEADRHILILHEDMPGLGLANGQLVGATDTFSNINKEGRLLFPVRAISQYLGFTVNWDASKQTATLQNQSGHQIIFTIGIKNALIDNNIYDIPTAPIIDNDKVMLPIRPLIEALNGSISYEQGLIILSDKKDSFTEKQTQSLTLMKELFSYIQNKYKTLADPLSLTLLAQTGSTAYWRDGLNTLYIESHGVKKAIDLGQSVQLILGIDNNAVYYIAGKENLETGQLVNGQLCRTDLTSQKRQILLDNFSGYTQTRTKMQAATDTYFIRDDIHDYNYLIIPEGSANLGGYTIYQLGVNQATKVTIALPENMYVTGLDNGFKNPLVFGNDLYYFSHYMGITPGLYHIKLQAGSTAQATEKILTNLTVFKMISLNNNQLIALASPYHDVANNDFMNIYQINLDTLEVKQLTNDNLPIRETNNILILSNDTKVLYLNQANKLCFISPLL